MLRRSLDGIVTPEQFAAAGVAPPRVPRTRHVRVVPPGRRRRDSPHRHPMSTWRAHAKLTMSLHVTGVRDDGYHLIDAEMVSLELHDLLSFEPCDPSTDPALTAIGPFADGVPTDGTNLVARALDLAGSPRRHDDRQAHPARRRARWRIDRRGRRTALGRLRHRAGRNSSVPVVSAPTSRSASSAGAPGLRDRRNRRTSPPSRPHGDARDPAAAREHPRGLPPWDDLGQPSDGERRNDLEAAAIVVEPDLARWRRPSTNASTALRRSPAAAPRGSSRDRSRASSPTSLRSARPCW